MDRQGLANLIYLCFLGGGKTSFKDEEGRTLLHW